MNYYKFINRVSKHTSAVVASIGAFALLFAAANFESPAYSPKDVYADSDNCPHTGEWTKKDGLTGLSYTFTPVPDGFIVTDNCMKVGSHDPVYGAGATVTNNILFNKPECTAVGRGCSYQAISHASFRLVAKPTPTPTITLTPTDTPNLTPTNSPAPTATQTPTPTVTVTPTVTQTPNLTPTATPSATATPTPGSIGGSNSDSSNNSGSNNNSGSVSSTSTSQIGEILGVSTFAGTGTALTTFANLLGVLGASLVAIASTRGKKKLKS